MPLILQPSFDGKSREEIEQHLLVVRAKRMRAVAVYYAGVNAKAMHKVSKFQQRLSREYNALAGDINKMNALELKVEKRLATLEQILQELQEAQESFVEVEEGD